MDDRRQKTNSEKLRVVVMGSPGVGKSQMISTLISKQNVSGLPHNIKDYYQHTFDDKGGSINLEILDTEGDQCYPGLRRLTIATGDAFILMYAINDRESFHELNYYRGMIEERNGLGKTPIMVVANKVDMKLVREVPDRNTTEDIVTKDWEHMFMSASALDDVSVNEVFRELVRQSKAVYKERFPCTEPRRMTTPKSLLKHLRDKYKLRKQNSM
ncbi:ras-related protein Rap-2a-like [Haliotis rufescens]|uniref:ras-related protein Rap-2a-like n=1 Tax=Haliotis rufescens TaxID=6454 RepID=UPI001EAFEBDE|nr:ras-related protein Rap-2a-like [Haliotis rufescens]